jgi:hypothetical protein
MEQTEGGPLEISRDGKVRVPVHPFEIVSVRVNYPRAGSDAAGQLAH